MLELNRKKYITFKIKKRSTLKYKTGIVQKSKFTLNIIIVPNTYTYMWVILNN